MRVRLPGSIGLAALAWLLVGGLLIASWFGQLQTDGEPSVGTITDALGDDAVAGTSGSASGSALPLLLGAIIVLLTAGLLLRHGWTQWVLLPAGFIGIIAIASSGRWSLLMIGMLAVFVGSVALMPRSARRFLATSPATTDHSTGHDDPSPSM
ncbi:hypothetical protein [Pseudonocardia abyssalis]|uniref:Uncharacterized protein n=1 Tax=Pseudonocardia abyssalis TaxID=2792008 RepID=A0ABS6URB8_9PSEU|nr:hypothetical protein [Pseudonocardia abyssalis]MBW0113735.1 hypothetical protein [Pseudonocardia abyssalis]MBW0134808.1 hypothetical protein [Pseudonocardia abyssalis]